MKGSNGEYRRAVMPVAKGMSRRKVIKSLVLATLGAPFLNFGRYSLFGQTERRYSKRAIELVGSSLVIDMLGPLTVNPTRWIINPDSFTSSDLQKYKDSGISVFHLATGMGDYQTALRYIAGWNGFMATHDRYFMRIDSVADLEAVKTSGKLGCMLGTQDSVHFRTLDDINTFYNLGQRCSQLTYNERNLIGNGCTERSDSGLSDYGVAVVGRMNEVGMAVDLSHCGDRTTLDGIETSTKPVLITHGNCRALVEGHVRAKTDEAMKELATKGGVMGVSNLRNLVLSVEPTTVEHVLDHYDYAIKLIGVDHIGIGSDSDLDGWDAIPAEMQQRLKSQFKPIYRFREKMDIEGLNHPKKVFDLTEGLIRRRYSDENIKQILGQNFKRVLSQIWKG